MVSLSIQVAWLYVFFCGIQENQPAYYVCVFPPSCNGFARLPAGQMDRQGIGELSIYKYQDSILRGWRGSLLGRIKII